MTRFLLLMDNGIREHERIVKTALKKANLSGSFVVGKYRCSPYMACEHGCVYCDGRAERYFVEGDFARDIVVRSNLPDRLSAEIPRLREKGFITMGSGVTDAYQPLEAEKKLTRRCAEVFTAFNSPVTVMTKSALALRDIDVWKEVAAGPGFMFLVSLTFTKDDERQIFEPGASSVEERIEALKKFKEAGCYTGILAMPLLPGITDTDENLEALFCLAKDAQVDFIMPTGLTLRPGRQKSFFFNQIAQTHPDLLSLYKELYHENRESGVPVSDYGKHLSERCAGYNKRFEIPFLVPHRVFSRRLHSYDEMNVLLYHMSELYGARGVDTRPLKTAVKKYIAWLTERKADYNRKRSTSFRWLERELEKAVSTGEMAILLGNERLAGFFREVVLEKKVFDYLNLELIPADADGARF
jgi:DNA repair photolyase